MFCSKIFCATTALKIVLAAALIQAMVVVAPSAAQESNSKALEDQRQLQKKLVLEIYESTKTAKSAKDYSGILDLCDNALAQNLSTKNREYVTSLTGWARNRRGQERFELASNLERVGNGQAEAVKRQAMEDFDESLKADSKRYRSWMARGVAHASSSNFKQAALDFTEVVKLKTDYANGWFNRAECLYHLEKFENAIEDYNVALRLDSEDAEALTGRAHSNLALKNLTEAIKDYDKVIELQPENSVAYVNRSEAYAEQCEWQKSLADLEKAKSLEASPLVLEKISWLKATCVDDEIFNASEALALINQAISKNGKTAQNLEVLAAAQAAAGDFKQAASNQENAIQLAGSEVDDSDLRKVRLSLYEKNEPYKQGELKK